MSVFDRIFGGDEPDPLSGFSDDELQTAALRIMPERISTQQSWIGGTVAQCDEALIRCALLREKYKDYSPPRMRKAIMGWIDHFEYMARKDREDCKTQKSKNEQIAYRARCEAEQEKTRRVLDTLSSRPTTKDGVRG